MNMVTDNTRSLEFSGPVLMSLESTKLTKEELMMVPMMVMLELSPFKAIALPRDRPSCKFCSLLLQLIAYCSQNKSKRDSLSILGAPQMWSI